MPTIPTTSAIGRINALVDEISGVKQAAAKQATELGLSGEGKADPGGYHGKSDHPSARAASNVQKTPLGSRAKENESDVKHDHPGAGVDNVSEGSGGSQDDKQLNIGTHQSATGEDPKVEDDYKGDKDDKRQGDRGGTSGPYNAEDVGEKYSSYQFRDLTKVAFANMNAILADIAEGRVDEPTNKRAAYAPAGNAQSVGAPSDHEKQAAAAAIIEATIIDARVNADLVGEFLTKYSANYAHMLKGAATDGPMGGAMDGGMPGGDAGGGEMPPPEAGGGGGMPGEGGGGGEDGGLDEFISALLAMGKTPEEIEAALQTHLGGGAAGGPPGAGGGPGGDPMAAAGGGAPPMGGGDMGKAGSARGLNDAQLVMYKAANLAKHRFRAGNWQPKPVVPGTKEAQDRFELQQYIREVCGLAR